jgi:hypothetical protein
MSLPDWLANRWLVTHEPSVDEIADLPAVVDRDLADAAVPRLSSDWRSGISYNAALQLATLAVAASGYRPAREQRTSGRFFPCATLSAWLRRPSTCWTRFVGSEIS